MELLVTERKLLYEQQAGKSTSNDKIKTLQAWQDRWQDNMHTGQWTKELIPDLGVWIKSKHRNVDYQLTQAPEECVYYGNIDTA